MMSKMAFIVDPTTDKTIGDVLLPRILGHGLLELPPAGKAGKK